MDRKIKKMRADIIASLKAWIEDEFDGNQAQAGRFLGEQRGNLKHYLDGQKGSLEKLLCLLHKAKAYRFEYKINRR